MSVLVLEGAESDLDRSQAAMAVALFNIQVRKIEDACKKNGMINRK